MSVCFSAMTSQRAAAWLGTKSMAHIRDTGVVPGLLITGAWANRRFVIAAAKAMLNKVHRCRFSNVIRR